MKKFLLLTAALGLLAGTIRAEKINLGGGKSALLTVPETWVATDVPPQPADLPPLPGRTVRYVPKSGSNDALFISLLPMDDDRVSDRDSLKALVEQASQQFVPGSVEGKANLTEFKLGGATGYAVTFTDAKLVGQPSVKEDYKAMTSFYVYLGDHVMVNATIFTDDVTGKTYAEALRALKSLSLLLPGNTL